MRGTPGIAGRLFSAVGAAGINILVIAQGSSERNISFVIEEKNRTLALRTIHSAFLSAKKA
jgi:aspartokinase/homoserine dehydrogenase 1